MANKRACATKEIAFCISEVHNDNSVFYIIIIIILDFAKNTGHEAVILNICTYDLKRLKTCML